MSSARVLSDTGLSWLGTIPRSWQVVPLRYLAEFRSGGTPSKDQQHLWGGIIPWASAKDLKSDILYDTMDHLDEAAITTGSAQLLPEGAVIVLVRGMMLAKSFPVARLAVPMAINQDLKGLLPCAGVDAGFLAWALRGTTTETLNRLDEAGHGTKALRMDAWVSMQLAVPSLPEQRAIAAFLDRETARIDALVEAQRRLIELLKEKRQAVISHAVTKGLDPSAPMKDSGVEWLGEVPAHWEVVPIKRVTRTIEQGWSPQCENYPAQNPDERGVLKVGCVNGGAFTAEENKLLPADLEPPPGLDLRAGDLLVSRANTRELVGSAAVALSSYPNLLLCDKLYRLRLDAVRCSPLFLARFLGCRAARFQIELSATGASASMLNIGQSTVLELPSPMPPLSEQVAILHYLENELSKIDGMAGEASRTIILLQERRSALISAAVTGKIDVRNLDQKAVAA